MALVRWHFQPYSYGLRKPSRWRLRKDRRHYRNSTSVRSIDHRVHFRSHTCISIKVAKRFNLCRRANRRIDDARNSVESNISPLVRHLADSICTLRFSNSVERGMANFNCTPLPFRKLSAFHHWSLGRTAHHSIADPSPSLVAFDVRVLLSACS